MAVENEGIDNGNRRLLCLNPYNCFHAYCTCKPYLKQTSIGSESDKFSWLAFCLECSFRTVIDGSSDRYRLTVAIEVNLL